MTATRIVWFRRDLRVGDNPALAAAGEAETVIGLYVAEDAASGLRPLGAASRWWLHHSLAALDRDLGALGIPLVLRHGDAASAVAAVARTCGAAVVHCARVHEPSASRLETRVGRALATEGRTLAVSEGSLLLPPGSVRGKGGKPYRVFTPYWNAWRQAAAPSPAAPKPPRRQARPKAPPGERLEDWRLLPTAPDWAGGLRTAWRPGEAGARARLTDFLEAAVGDYATARDIPADPGTSRLSPHLHFGEITPGQIWHAALSRAGDRAATWAFLRELCWREFNHDLLHQDPEMPVRNIDPRFDAFPWRDDAAALHAWQRGRTGYPLVDAGMRALWTTGWMHNRVRMVVASFLVKHLLLDWRQGEAWFWDTLVDADLANNAANWQWVAGSGVDAAPWFRIFNPVLQGRRFDADGAYVRRWVPEIAARTDRHLHEPAGTGDGYPGPIVDHGFARQRALAAFDTVRRNR